MKKYQKKNTKNRNKFLFIAIYYYQNKTISNEDRTKCTQYSFLLLYTTKHTYNTHRDTVLIQYLTDLPSDSIKVRRRNIVIIKNDLSLSL